MHTEFDEFNVNIATHELQPGERLLLCSDGLNEVVSDVEIAALFITNSDDDLLNALMPVEQLAVLAVPMTFL